MDLKMATSCDRIEDLRHLENALQSASGLMASQVRHEDAAIFIGTTRSGKSSLINYLIGNNLVGERVAACKPVSIKKADLSPGPQIGIGTTSETIIPTRWDSPNISGLAIWDAPGFNDNRGEVQDITNAFYIYELFKNIRSVKIVLVTDINDISRDDIQPFLSLLTAVENLLKEKMRDCFDSIAVIFTKVPMSLNDSTVDMNFINQLLEVQFLSSNTIAMSESAKDFVRFLTKNNQNIGLFKRATTGPITSAIDEGIIPAIQNANRLEENVLRQVFPSISDKSNVFLFQVREKLSSMATFEVLQNTVRDALQRKLNNYGEIDKGDASVDTLNAVYKELSDIRNQINQSHDPTIGFHKKVDALQMIDPEIERLIREENLLEKSNLMEFVDRLLDLRESNQFDFSMQGVMATAMARVGELTISIQLKLGEISRKEAEVQLQQAQENHQSEVERLNKEIEKAMQHNKRRSGFFGQLLNSIGYAIGSMITQRFRF